MLDDSDFSDNKLIMTMDFDSCSEESDELILVPKKSKRKQKVKAGSASVCNFLDQSVK